MADHQQIMDLARRGALAQKKEHYKALLAEIENLCGTLQRASVMMLPGNLDDIKEDQIKLASGKLHQILPEARALKKELEREGLSVW